MSKFEEISKFVEIAKGTDRTRRNVFKIGAKLGAVAGAAVIASMTKIKPAAAIPDHVCTGPAGPHNPHCCFIKGTTIRTVDGDRKVEDLAAGDLLSTMFSGNRPIQWIGRYSYKKSDPSKAWVKDALPVRIARSAMGPNIPHADLFVTQAHALFFDGVLVPAGNLANGTTITLYDAHECSELEYYHIKLENHDVIYAEGAPCETLLQVDENATNFAEYYRIYGAPTPAPVSCVPLLTYNGTRSEIKSRLRSALSPWIDRREKIDVIRDHLEERGLSVF
jgi:Hint domain-containing protein